MASIVECGGRFCVVYTCTTEDGKRKQKWETYKTMAEAKLRKTEVEYKQQTSSFTVPECRALSELLKEYVSLYGKTKWSISAFSSNTSLIRNYIEPIIGHLNVREITARVLEKYYQTLQHTPAAARCTDRNGKKHEGFVTVTTIRKIHALLRSVFNQAEKWELIEKNPALHATVPKAEEKPREIWDAQTLFNAIDTCDDERLKLCMNLAFACSLRLGEVLGLTWDCVDISEESIAAGRASVHITKELQRVSKKVMDTLESKDVIVTFPEQSHRNTTVLVLKKPKTKTSIRKVFLPRTVAEMLIRWKEEQDAVIEALGSEYQAYHLVIAGPFGTPVEGSRIRAAMDRLIKEKGLPKVVFHSLRHSSITYKLKLNGGDIKAVQGDSGHAQAQMVTDQYSHILDESRQTNAQLLEEAFYGGRGAEAMPKKQDESDGVSEKAADAGIDPTLLAKILANPEMVSLLKSLSKAIE